MYVCCLFSVTGGRADTGIFSQYRHHSDGSFTGLKMYCTVLYGVYISLEVVVLGFLGSGVCMLALFPCCTSFLPRYIGT